jgi:hypothetical protein
MDYNRVKDPQQSTINYMLEFYNHQFSNLPPYRQPYNGYRLCYLTTLIHGLMNGGMSYTQNDLRDVYNLLDDLFEDFRSLSTIDIGISVDNLPIVDKFLTFYENQGFVDSKILRDLLLNLVLQDPRTRQAIKGLSQNPNISAPIPISSNQSQSSQQVSSSPNKIRRPNVVQAPRSPSTITLPQVPNVAQSPPQLSDAIQPSVQERVIRNQFGFPVNLPPGYKVAVQTRREYIASTLGNFKVNELKTIYRFNNLKVPAPGRKDQLIGGLTPHWDSLRFPGESQPATYEQYLEQSREIMDVLNK